MKSSILGVCGVLLAAPSVSAGETDTEREVRETILKTNAHARETGEITPDAASKHGTVECWSSGGLMHELAAGSAPEGWDRFNVRPRHIKVISLVEGQAAVAMYYSEGSMKPKGGALVPHYMTRVTEVYVKEDGKWKVRAAHWSPIAAGSGTSQTAE
jgi:hypothetical protein